VVQNETVEPAQLIPQLRAVSEERKRGNIFLRADRGIHYEVEMQVMAELNASGFNEIGLVTEQGGPTFDGRDG
jgi:biopolymer transport protein TolR